MADPAAAGDLLADLPGMAGARVSELLADGPSNTTWLVLREDERWVLRIDKAEAVRLGLDRERERLVAETVATARLSVGYEMFDPTRGFCLRRYVSGKALEVSDLDPDTLSALASILQKLHALRGSGAVFDLVAAARRYAVEIGTAEAQHLAEDLARRHAEIAPLESGPVLCHNDLVCSNILRVDGGDLMLIDWEYAAPGDPWFDLAVVVQHHGLNEKHAQHFLAAWLGRAPGPADTERLSRHCAFYARLLELWNLRVG